MAEASPLLTVTPKQLGKHLRDVRRKKGLSLSEVARGAGLSRRELVAYERAKVPIPESDLWVIAGSCGVDVSELLPSTSALELAAGSTTTVGDTVSQLRRNQEDVGMAPYLATLNRLRALPPGKRVKVKDRELDAMADALGRDPATLEARLQSGMRVSPEEAARLREIILPPVRPVVKPRALEAAVAATPMTMTMPAPPPAFLDTPIDPTTAQNVDVFAELARLPEPLPLGDPTTPLPDLLAPPPPPGTVELVEGMPQPVNANVGFGANGFAGMANPEPLLVDTAIAAWNAADAPPIDVARRQGSDTWDWGDSPAAPLTERPVTGAPLPHGSANGETRDPAPWQPPAPPGGASEAPPAFWEGTDDWTPSAAEPAVAAPESDAWAPTDWEADHWGSDQWGAAQWGAAGGDASPAPEVAATADPAPWEHEPDPEAISTGFYVDWGTPETDDAPPAWEALIGADTSDLVVDTVATVETHTVTPVVPEWQPEPAPVLDEHDSPPPIMWRADPVAPVVLDASPQIDAHEPEPQPEPEPEPEPEGFVSAGSDWQLGNALPLVEVRGKGALVMRRADERWALADVTTPPDFVLEVDVDFSSGPGLGVLFRASVDDEGRMSGYSFDIDPIYDGGGYLVRQWSADRELWNPIARVASGDPSSMYGSLTVRLVVTDEQLVAAVNGVEVLTVESLKQASTDRGRDAATGDRVGVQAWSSSDLVIDSLRVAAR